MYARAYMYNFVYARAYIKWTCMHSAYIQYIHTNAHILHTSYCGNGGELVSSRLGIFLAAIKAHGAVPERLEASEKIINNHYLNKKLMDGHTNDVNRVFNIYICKHVTYLTLHTTYTHQSHTNAS